MHTTDYNGNVLGPSTSEEIALLDNQFSRAPIAYQDALEAIHGLKPWDASYERLTPAYARARELRS